MITIIKYQNHKVIYISINHNHKQKSEEAVKGTYDYANYTFKKVFATYGTSITF
jgi:choline kinase